MRVVLSVDALKPPLTGIGRYVHELASQLPALGIGLQALLRGRPISEEALRQRKLMAQSGVLRRGGWETAGRLVENQAWLAQVGQAAVNTLSSFRPLQAPLGTVAHGPNYYLPATRGMKRVVTFHDLSTLRFPHWHLPGRAARITRAMYQMAKSADCILADSEAVRNEILEAFGRSESEVIAVPLGVTDDYRPRGAAELMPILESRGLRPGAYVLSVCTLEPRKNILRTIEAYARLPQRIRTELPLVLVGRRGWQERGILDAMELGQAAGWLRYLGYVPQNELPALVSGALCFVYPSLYEGFGLPVLEAMASAIPVVTSNRGALAEVAGDAAELVAPEETEAIAAALLRLIEDEPRRNRAAQLGLARAATFSWANCAAETAAVYGQLCPHPR